MSSFNASKLTDAVHATVRVGAALSHGTLVYPYAKEVKREQLRARRGPKPLQWLIERDTFERQIAEQYAQLQNGVVRELVAGTGVGKTTVLPFVIARNYQVNGLVLMPDATYALRTYVYVAKRVAAEGGDVKAVFLRSEHIKKPLPAPAVYFADADTFLGRLAQNPKLLSTLGIDFIFLDESHSGTPGYKFFQYAVSAGIITGCKVFYGTATAAADTVMESGGAGKSVMKVSPKVLSADNPRGVTAQSPLHYTQIQDQTLVVLSNDQEIDQWFQYYDDHDIPAYRCSLARGHTVEIGIDDFLATHNPCVLLTTGKFRTSVTLDIGTVIDCGYETKAVSDFSTYTVNLQRVPITEALRIQSMGRVGRFRPGRGFYADIEYRHESGEMDDDTAFYVYLWAIAFNLKINEPLVSQFDGLFSTPMTIVAAAILLHGRLPPLLMLPYVGDDGFFRGWHVVGKYVLFSHGSIDTYDEAPVDTARWVEYNTGPVDYATAPVAYKSLVKFPREWAVIPAFAWAMHQGQDLNVGMMRTASVISAAPSVRSVKPTNQSRLSLNSVSTHDNTLWTGGRTGNNSVESIVPQRPVTPLRRDSVGSGLPHLDDTRALLGVPTVQHVRTAYSVRDTIPSIRDVPTKHVRSESVEEVPRNPVELWQKSLGSPPKTRVSRVGSDPSDDRDQIELRPVDPVKYKQYKLYPMDSELFKVFIEYESANRHDKVRIAKMLNGTENIVNMRGDVTSRKERQGEYFLSTIKVHNAAVVQRAQLAANRSANAIAKLHMLINGNERATDIEISETAGLLKAFQLENFYVGIDKRQRRSYFSEELYTPDYDRQEAQARIMMAFGPSKVVTCLGVIVELCRPVVFNGTYLANAWQMCDVVVTVQHTFEDNSFLPAWASDVRRVSEDADVMLFGAVQPVSETIVFRDGVADESVYIVTYDRAQRQAVIIGVYSLHVSGEAVFVNANLAGGASGALVVAASDGAAVGMYSGYFGRVAGDDLSIVVPSAAIRSVL